MNRILKSYLKRLTNLSTRNRSLLLPGLPSEQFIDITETNFLLGKPGIDILVQAVQGRGRIALCDIQDPRLARSNEVSKKLRKIARTESFIQEERGSRDLYLGYPFVKGKLADGTPIHAPLLFFPVTLKIDREQWCLFERDDVGVSLNRSFALAYAHFNETTVSDEVLEKSFEEFSGDFLEFRTQLYEWLKETPLRINFNQDLFENKLIPFEAKRGSQLQAEEHNGELKLFSEAVLGIFPQSGSYLVPDYNQLLERGDAVSIPILKSDLSELTTETSEVINGASGRKVKIKEEELLTPFALDASQEKIILAAKSGQSLVVQGPPGSGKSQLICNLMADFSARGKRVLLVCQKRAALDVVHQRLMTIGMGSFTALIHDFKNDRATLYKQLASQIDQVETYRQQNYSLDAVFLDRQFARESRLIDKTVEELDAFRHALFDESECGISIKELYLTSDPAEPQVDLNQYYKSFRLDDAGDYTRRLRTYSKYRSFLGVNHSWFQRKSFASYGLADMHAMEKMLSDWPQAFQHQTDSFKTITGSAFEDIFLVNRDEILERLEDIKEQIGNQTSFLLFKAYIFSESNPHARLSFIRQTTESLEGFIAEDGVEDTLSSNELTSFRTQLVKVIETKKSTVKGVWWDLFGSEKEVIAKVASLNGLSTSTEDLLKLELKVRNRIQLESWLRNEELLFDEMYLHGGEERSQDFLNFFHNAEAAADAAARANFEAWSRIIKELANTFEKPEAFSQKCGQLTKWLQTWDRMEVAMEPFLLEVQIVKLLNDPDQYSEILLRDLRSDFDSIADMDRLLAEMNSVERDVSKILIEECEKRNATNPDEIIELFGNSIRLAWIGHIENRYPQLRAVTSLKMQEWEEQIQESIVSKQELSSQIAGIKLRENVYEDIEKNRLGNRVTYRELNHQVTKKRNIWPIRKLLDSYQDDVFSLMPCWMASPEAVSAIFPMEGGLFDLVIFDEASQCYAEYGLPAAFRGKQVVVAGDSKQLSPSDLYKVRYDEKSEDEDYSPALEIESLLDLAAQSLVQYQLSGHYRSQSFDLIDFSNKHFYKNTLQLLPDFNNLNKREPGIIYEKVDGVWKNSANLVEAERVLALLSVLKDTGKSVGVVTFNFYQQQAIQEAVEREGLLVKDLFVKNIENVQGDERDIIIFSMGYAQDEKGKLSMNFGSFNMQGGENRLNVAITRAREKVFFVTSLWPFELNTDGTANEGPKLLRSYLQYAQEVSDGKFKASQTSTDGFRTSWFLKNRLLKANEQFSKDLPFGDITIKEEETYKGLILTDDDLYHRSDSSKEPHAYLPLLLRQKHWPFRRVYSREYWTKTLKLESLKVP
jgi:hypothetical protein